MIKVILKRRVKPQNYGRLIGLLRDLRAAAIHQPGYITGETVMRGENPIEVLAIGSWLSERHWQAWATSQARNELESMVDLLIVGKVETTVYEVPAEDI
jgi:antibiotic biosynthesis monooxygenase (ABM) superfamily enzyme